MENLSNNSNQKNNNNNNSEIFYKCISTLTGHTDFIYCLIELSTGELVSGSYDKTIKIWNKETKKCTRTIKEKNAIISLLEFKKYFLLSGTENNEINLRSLLSKQDTILFIFKPKGNDISEIFNSINSLVKCNLQYFASASRDNTLIKIWDYENEKINKTLIGHNGNVLCLILLKGNKNKNKLCSGGSDWLIKIWNWLKGSCDFTINQNKNSVYCLLEINDYHYDNKENENFIISGNKGRCFQVWKNFKKNENDKDDYRNICNIIDVHKFNARNLCLINKKYFASCEDSIKIWRRKDMKCIQEIKGHIRVIVENVIYTHDGFLVSASHDQTIKIFSNK